MEDRQQRSGPDHSLHPCRCGLKVDAPAIHPLSSPRLMRDALRNRRRAPLERAPQIIRAQQDVLHETKVHPVECDEDLIGFRITLLVRLDHSIGSTPSLKDLILGYVY